MRHAHRVWLCRRQRGASDATDVRRCAADRAGLRRSRRSGRHARPSQHADDCIAADQGTYLSADVPPAELAHLLSDETPADAPASTDMPSYEPSAHTRRSGTRTCGTYSDVPSYAPTAANTYEPTLCPFDGARYPPSAQPSYEPTTSPTPTEPPSARPLFRRRGALQRHRLTRHACVHCRRRRKARRSRRRIRRIRRPYAMQPSYHPTRAPIPFRDRPADAAAVLWPTPALQADVTVRRHAPSRATAVTCRCAVGANAPARRSLVLAHKIADPRDRSADVPTPAPSYKPTLPSQPTLTANRHWSTLRRWINSRPSTPRRATTSATPWRSFIDTIVVGANGWHSCSCGLHPPLGRWRCHVHRDCQAYGRRRRVQTTKPAGPCPDRRQKNTIVVGAYGENGQGRGPPGPHERRRRPCSPVAKLGPPMLPTKGRLLRGDGWRAPVVGGGLLQEFCRGGGGLRLPHERRRPYVRPGGQAGGLRRRIGRPLRRLRGDRDATCVCVCVCVCDTSGGFWSETSSTRATTALRTAGGQAACACCVSFFFWTPSQLRGDRRQLSWSRNTGDDSSAGRRLRLPHADGGATYVRSGGQADGPRRCWDSFGRSVAITHSAPPSWSGHGAGKPLTSSTRATRQPSPPPHLC